MKRVALALFSSITGLVILLGFKTHTTTATAPAAISTTTTDTNNGSVTSTSSAPATQATSAASPTTATKASSAATSATKTYTGTAVDTRYGAVQVQITVTNGKITAANAIQYPQNDPRDQQINSYAVPQLNSEALAKQSSTIDTVSGATYTSTGYIQSLQSAINQAGL